MLSPCCGVPWIDDGGPRYCAACGSATTKERADFDPPIAQGQTVASRIVRNPSTRRYQVEVAGQSYPLGTYPDTQQED